MACWHELHAAAAGLWLLGSEGVAEDWLARELAPAAAERTRFFVAQRAPWGFYGYEAMALILDAIAAAGARPGRGRARPRAARATATRSSAATRSTPTGTRRRPPTAGSPSPAASWSGTAGSISPPCSPTSRSSTIRPARRSALLAELTGHLCITGGSTPRAAYERLAELRTDWSGVDVWFTDERCVPPDHEHSNFRMANEALLARARARRSTG